jgi:hypothetical protein
MKIFKKIKEILSQGEEIKSLRKKILKLESGLRGYNTARLKNSDHFEERFANVNTDLQILDRRIQEWDEARDLVEKYIKNHNHDDRYQIK